MKLVPLLLALFLVGCVNTGSHVMIGQARPPTDPSLVTVYSTPPPHYVAIAHVAADSGAMWPMSDVATTEEAMRQLKMEAASVGANGLIDVSLPKRAGGISQVQVATATAVWVQ